MISAPSGKRAKASRHNPQTEGAGGRSLQADQPANIHRADPFTVAANEILLIAYRLNNQFPDAGIDDVTAKLEEAFELLNTLSAETRERWLVDGQMPKGERSSKE